MDNNQTFTAKTTQEFVKSKNVIFFNSQVYHLIPVKQSMIFRYCRGETEGKETHKQARVLDFRQS